jgi:hypothetical protein
MQKPEEYGRHLRSKRHNGSLDCQRESPSLICFYATLTYKVIWRTILARYRISVVQMRRKNFLGNLKVVE